MTWRPKATPTVAGVVWQLSGGTLKPHVGHRVGITGTMAAPMKDAMAKDSTHAMAKPDAKKDEMALAPTLPVKSLEMVAASCS